MKKLWYILIGVGVIGGGWWLYTYATAPIPGQSLPALGREHVGFDVVEKTTYNSNPPTSGSHYEEPSRPGIYDSPQHDGQLIHSLEHGYVIISYNCDFLGHKDGVIPAGETLGLAPVATASALPESGGCQTLKKQLVDLATAKKLWKLIVVPRPTLDSAIALTAWTYIDKFNTFDAKRIQRFIDYHRDHGPEQTME